VIDDIFEVQSDIATEVVSALGVMLQGDELEILEERPTDSIEAYQAYLRGIDLWGRYELKDSVSMFGKAVALDPAFPQAWAKLCRGKAQQHFSGRDPSAELLPEAERALAQAQALAPEDLEVRLAQAYYFYYGQRDFDRALEEIEQIARDFPNDPEVLQGRAFILRRQGHLQESTAALLDSLTLDPRNAFTLLEVARNYRAQRMFEETFSYLDRAIALKPDNTILYEQKSSALIAQGSIEAARKVLASAPVTDPMHGAWMGVYYYDRRWDDYLEQAQRLPRDEPLDRADSDFFQGIALIRLGRSEEARAVLESAAGLLEEHLDEGSEWGPAMLLASTYSLLGRKEEALAQLQPASDVFADDLWEGRDLVDENLAWVYLDAGDVDAAVALWDRLLATDYTSSITVNHLRLDADLDPIRDDPRFQALLEKYGQEG
jgi:serine/threonine-protein kinase